MKPENRLPVVIFGVLAAAIVVPVLARAVRDALRPRLVEARVVTATDHDPVFRDGPRRVPVGHRLQLAVAVLLDQPVRRPRWLAPVARLNLGGEDVEHLEASVWPERDRALRVFWFTVECTIVGGDLTPDNAGTKLAYRTFLAPEMGHGLRAAADPEPHNDDHLGPPQGNTPPGAGTIRLHARVELYDPDESVRPLASVATLGVDRLLEPAFPAVHRAVELAVGLDPAAGELFLLPGFEPRGTVAESWNEVTLPDLGMPFTELVRRRLAVSSQTFAAVTVAGEPTIEDARLGDPISLLVDGGVIQRAGRAVRWHDEVTAGDLLVAGPRWIVLLGDDGNGVVDGGDAVAHCWRSPPAITTLAAALGTPPPSVELVRHVS